MRGEPVPSEGKTVTRFSIDMRSLSRVGSKPSLVDYIVSLWNYRHFMMHDARARVQSGNSRDKLGSAWLLLNPILNGIGYFFIFGVLLDGSRGIENFIGYLIIGVFLFQMSTRSIVAGSKTISSNQNMIQAFNFPRATLAVALNLREILANIPVLIAMFLLITFIPPNEEITWMWLLIIPAVLLQSTFNLGVGLLMAPLVARMNDLVHIISFCMRFWMFASCVMFSIDRYDQLPVMRTIVEGNPLYILLTIVRGSVLYAEMPSWQSWASLTAWAFGAVILGLFFFWKGEESYARND